MKISFDKRIVKSVGIISIVSFIMFFSAMIITETSGGRTDEGAVFLALAAYFFCDVFLITFIIYIVGKIYLIRLKNYGYEVPNDRREYDKKLTNLPKDEKVYKKIVKNQGARNKWSVWLALIHFLVLLTCVIFNICLYIEWKFLRDVGVFITELCVLDCFWLILTIYYFRQGDNSKYRDAFELDEDKKKRVCFPYGLMLLAVVAIATIFAKMQAFNTMKYMLKTFESEDLATLNTIRAAVAEEYKESPEALSEKSYILTDMDKPEGEFWTNVAEVLGISNYKELADKIRVADGKPKIEIRIDDDNVVVIELKNPHKKVKTEMILGE